jgi:hypothetical protein
VEEPDRARSVCGKADPPTRPPGQPEEKVMAEPMNQGQVTVLPGHLDWESGTKAEGNRSTGDML